MKKYEFTGTTRLHNNSTTVHQIRALVDFGSVKAGDIGGWIECEANLPNTTDDKSWIKQNSFVVGKSRVYDSIVDERSMIIDSIISHNSSIIESIIKGSDIIESSICKSTIIKSTVQRSHTMSSSLTCCVCAANQYTSNVEKSHLSNYIIINDDVEDVMSKDDSCVKIFHS